MKRQISWQNGVWTTVHRTSTSLRHLRWSCQESGQGLDEQKSQRTLGIHNWTESGKATYTRTLCQKNEGSVEVRDQLRWMVTLLTGHCHLKGHLFKLRLTDDPTCERSLGKTNQPHTSYVMRGQSAFKISSPGPVFMAPSDYYDAPINEALHFIRSVGLIKG
jgi:hypothetical protein